MGIINWMQSRFHGNKTENRVFDGATATSSYRGGGAQETTIHESKKRLDDGEPWPQAAGLLSIGTLGNEEPPAAAAQEQDLPEFTVEEVKKLQDALAMVLRRAKSKSSARGSGAGAGGEDRPPLDRFLNCPSCLEVDRRVQTTATATKHGGQEEGDLSPDTKIILSRARDLLDSGSGGGSVKQRSFKFLLKKMFACNGGGFSAALPRSLKDPIESRMEKFFRTVIGKKMNARSGNGPATSTKYFLEDGTSKGRKRRGGRRCGCQEEEEERGESCRWDRTDSEFIVLEI